MLRGVLDLVEADDSQPDRAGDLLDLCSPVRADEGHAVPLEDRVGALDQVEHEAGPIVHGRRDVAKEGGERRIDVLEGERREAQVEGLDLSRRRIPLAKLDALVAEASPQVLDVLARGVQPAVGGEWQALSDDSPQQSPVARADLEQSGARRRGPVLGELAGEGAARERYPEGEPDIWPGRSPAALGALVEAGLLPLHVHQAGALQPVQHANLAQAGAHAGWGGVDGRTADPGEVHAEKDTELAVGSICPRQPSQGSSRWVWIGSLCLVVTEELRRAVRYGLLRMPPALRALIEVQSLRARERYLVFSAGDDLDSERGLPLPPARMRVKVIGAADSASFIDSGQRQTAFFRRLLERNGIRLSTDARVLDFGCGCGRLARWWQEEEDPAIYGCDPNRELIEWCRLHLPALNATVSEPDPPLPYTDASFDFAYAMSVFTHLPPVHAQAWMAELRRVIKPGGHLLFTTAGEGQLDGLSIAEAVRFRRGEVVQFGTAVGSNVCLVYHPTDYVTGHLLDGLSLVDSALLSDPGLHGDSDSTQDSYLVQRLGS